MLLATQAIRDRYATRVLFLRRSALWLAIGFCIFHGLVTLPFVAARLFGTVTAADVTGTSTYLTHNKGNTTTHYVISARTADGFALDTTCRRRRTPRSGASAPTAGLRCRCLNRPDVRLELRELSR